MSRYDYDNFLNEKGEKTTFHRIKKMLERVLNKRPRRPASCQREIADNLANERLENEIFEEVDRCAGGAAVAVLDGGETRLMAVRRGERYVPVRFARTDKGTFFWTSVATPADGDLCRCGDGNALTARQEPEVQRRPRDRWAQA